MGCSVQSRSHFQLISRTIETKTFNETLKKFQESLKIKECRSRSRRSKSQIFLWVVIREFLELSKIVRIPQTWNNPFKTGFPRISINSHHMNMTLNYTTISEKNNNPLDRRLKDSLFIFVWRLIVHVRDCIFFLRLRVNQKKSTKANLNVFLVLCKPSLTSRWCQLDIAADVFVCFFLEASRSSHKNELKLIN